MPHVTGALVLGPLLLDDGQSPRLFHPCNGRACLADAVWAGKGIEQFPHPFQVVDLHGKGYDTVRTSFSDTCAARVCNQYEHVSFRLNIASNFVDSQTLALDGKDPNALSFKCCHTWLNTAGFPFQPPVPLEQVLCGSLESYRLSTIMMMINSMTVYLLNDSGVRS
jgi:hypothetical protein